MPRTVTLWPLLLVAALAWGGCGAPSDTLPPNVLRIGLLPDRADDELEAVYSRLLEHLSRRTGVPHETVLASSYEDLLNRFHRGEVDLARFGGATFVLARDSAGAIPLVMRDVDVRFRTCILIGADLPAQRLEDCEGLRLSFGSRLSTSGHLMPRFFLEQRGLFPEEVFSEVRYSERHDATVRAVQSGEVDLGAVNAKIVEDMVRSGEITGRESRVLWTSPPYADYAWAVRQELCEPTRRALLEAFLELSVDQPEHEDILRPVGASSYLPIIPSDFDSLSEILQSRDPEAQR